MQDLDDSREENESSNARLVVGAGVACREQLPMWSSSAGAPDTCVDPTVPACLLKELTREEKVEQRKRDRMLIKVPQR